MPTELALLANVEPETERLAELCEQRYPGGVLFESIQGGIRQFLDVDANVVATLFSATPIEVPGDAETAVVGDIGKYRLWMDITVPYGESTMGVQLALAIAESVGGVVRARS